MTVRKNCADVLRQVRHFRTSKYYWIDAICIDQQNIPEKNVQVARMGAIFEQAECVLACIGMHDHSSQLVASMFESFHSHLSRANVSLDAFAELQFHLLKCGLWFDQSKQGSEQMAERIACEESCYEWVDGIDDKALTEFLKAMKQLARRPYFWRIWTLQELWVTHEVHFFCGFDRLPVQTLLLWWGDWQHIETGFPYTRGIVSSIFSKIEAILPGLWPRNVLGSGRPHYLDSGLGENYLRILHRFLWRQTGLREGSASKMQQLTTAALMSICEGRKCQDPRDIVYGTLTIADWTSTKVEMPDGSQCADEDDPASFLPDYNLSAFELAKSLVPRFGDPYVIHTMCNYLQIDLRTEEVQQGIALRSIPWSQLPVSASMDEPHWFKSSSRLARFYMNGLRLGPDARYKLEDISAKSNPYTRIIDTSEYGVKGQCVAIACEGAQNGDWLIELDFKEALILRKCEDLLFIIGRALLHGSFCPNRWWPMSVWMDAEDAIVLLCSSPVHWPNIGNDSLLRDMTDRSDNVEDISAFVNYRVCREWGSSFAEEPLTYERRR